MVGNILGRRDSTPLTQRPVNTLFLFGFGSLETSRNPLGCEARSELHSSAGHKIALSIVSASPNVNHLVRQISEILLRNPNKINESFMYALMSLLQFHLTSFSSSFSLFLAFCPSLSSDCIAWADGTTCLPNFPRDISIPGRDWAHLRTHWVRPGGSSSWGWAFAPHLHTGAPTFFWCNAPWPQGIWHRRAKRHWSPRCRRCFFQASSPFKACSP